ncbi:MAG: DUF1735 and LamG domain-containing protein [Bacteroides acidifaciens]|nr:DUF1735 and LamG domain-containing protein [Bacteroides acidifaciens]
MKKLIFSLASICLLTACQNELYKNPLEDFQSEQGAFIDSKSTVQIFVEEDTELSVKDVKIALVKPTGAAVKVSVVAGDKEQLDRFNSKNKTDYTMLPAEMYAVGKEVEFASMSTSQVLDVTLKNVKFESGVSYALPIKIANGDVAGIDGEKETLIVLEQRIRTKCLMMKNTNGAEDANMWPEGLSVPQWTFEVMLNRAAYKQNNMAIGGTKQVTGSTPLDEIYTRFGDVTIDPNQLQIKTGASQIDVDKEKFAAQPNTWYMIAFVYDGKKTYVYVNRNLVAEQEIRSGEYKLAGFWIGGKNDYVREYRFWRIARTPKQLSDYAWKMVDPTDDDLVVYYPCNGKKRNDDGTIVEDETMIWDWSKGAHHLAMPNNAYYDDNSGNMFIFPEVK